MKIDVNQSDIRLDFFLVHELKWPRKRIQHFVRQGEVLLNGRKAKNSSIVYEGDLVELSESFSDQYNKPKPKFKLDFLYEDAELLVLNKPVGLTVHGGAGISSVTLVDLLKDYTTLPIIEGNEERPGIVHRLDRDTQGLMVIAKTKDAYESLIAQFKEHQVEKGYYCFVKGDVAQDDFVIDKPIGRQQGSQRKMRVVADHDSIGKQAISRIQVMKRYKTKTLVKVTPRTGRTHQIRVHLEWAGYPVIGDPLYGDQVNRTGQQLQAYFLRFKHPKTKCFLSFFIPAVFV